MWDEPVPGIPGKFSEIAWVDSVEYGGDDEERRVDDSLLDFDPAPLASFVAVSLGLIEGSCEEVVWAITEDDQDGPIHIVHLLVAAEQSARQVGGGLPRPGSPGGATPLAGFTLATSGRVLPALVHTLYEGGVPAATALVRSWDSQTRNAALEAVWGYWVAPIELLCADIPTYVFKKRP